MASIQPVKNGFRAAVYVHGVRDTKQFRTKKEAQAWGSARETELRKTVVSLQPGERYTLQDAFDKYEAEVAPTHKGVRWEITRLHMFSRLLPIDKQIGDISATDLAAWRDSRLKSVANSSVLREIKLLNQVFEVARKEWQWIGLNPLKDIRRPRAPEHRERTIAWGEIKRQLKAMRYSPRKPIRMVCQAVAVTFLVALRTGMRAGELTSMHRSQLFPRFARLPDSKTGKSRDVPLTSKSLRLIAKLEDWDDEMVFGLHAKTLDALFRRYRERAGLDGFTFHDSRHTAATWLAKKVDVLTLCKIFGWSSTKMALVYYNPSASDIADRLE